MSSGAPERKRPTRRRNVEPAPAAPAAAAPAPAPTEETPARRRVNEWAGGPEPYPATFESVADFAAQTGRLVAVDDEWVAAVHPAGEDAEVAPGALWKKLLALMSVAPNSGGGDAPQAVSLMEEVHSLVAQGVGLLAPDVKTTMFPGPMARPLTEATCTALVTPGVGEALPSTDAPPRYWLLEKSDGLRVMMYSKFVKKFPRWYVAASGGAGGTEASNQLLSLYDTLLLEMTLEALTAKKRTESKAGMPLSKMLRGEETLRLVILPEGKGYELRTAAGNAAPLKRTTDEGYSFGYVFDRSFQVHLLLDDVAFTGKTALLDGEFVRNLRTGRVEYLLFDVPVVTDHQGEARPRLLGMQPMSARVAEMDALVQHRAADLAKRGATPYIAIKTKQFYRSEDVHKLLGRIQKTPAEGYVYAEENRTDGVVLTPEDGAAMQFRPGTCTALLKWKFPDTLTIDWLARVRDGFENATPRHFYLSYLVKDKAADSWYEEQVLYKDAVLRMSPGLKDNPGARMDAGKDYVAECRFHVGKAGKLGFWVVTGVRKDKTVSNSYMTAASVLESVAENFDAAKLVAKLNPAAAAAAPAAAPALAPSKAPGEKFNRPFCRFILRMHRDVTSADPFAKRLTLQVRVKTSRFSAPRSFTYVAGDECFGLGCPSPAVDHESPLTFLLYIELANQGGCHHWSDCCCEAVFDPSAGRWEVLRVIPRSNDGKNLATIKGVLEHLEETCSYGKSRVRITGSDGVEKVRAALVDSDAHYAGRSVDKKLDGRLGVRSNLRGFNNWVKSVLIMQACHAADPAHMKYIETNEAREVNATQKQKALMVLQRKSLRVLDLCCGRGGDLLKWFAAHPRAYVGIDSCLQAVGMAAKRYSDGQTSTNSKAGVGMPARFIPVDAFSTEGLERALDALDKLLTSVSSEYVDQVNQFSLVSCQFSLHYSFATKDRAAAAVANVACALQDGGVFTGTIVNSEELLARRARHGEEFGNGSYRVKFKTEGREGGSPSSDPDEDTLYGQRYNFTLESCVDGEDEYIIHWDAFVALCARHRLRLLHKTPFEAFYRTHAAEEKYAAYWEKTVGAPLEHNAALPAAPPAKRMRLSSPDLNPTSPNLAPTSPDMAPTSPNMSPNVSPAAPPAAPVEAEPEALPEAATGPPPLINIKEYLTAEEQTASFLYTTFAFVKDPRGEGAD